MLLRVSEEEIQQRCDACGAERAIPLTTLRAGVEVGDPPQPMNPSIIALPGCPTCDAREFLVRVAGATGAGRPALTGHAQGVNALHHALVAAGQVAPTLGDDFDGEATFDRAALPWVHAGERPPIVGRPGAAELERSRLLAARRAGG
ncbi:MAG: hypothetical protein R3B09_09335 [Nannocystaceae bacterium]